jgi:hypothetical protein
LRERVGEPRKEDEHDEKRHEQSQEQRTGAAPGFALPPGSELRHEQDAQNQEEDRTGLLPGSDAVEAVSRERDEDQRGTAEQQCCRVACPY